MLVVADTGVDHHPVRAGIDNQAVHAEEKITLLIHEVRLHPVVYQALFILRVRQHEFIITADHQFNHTGYLYLAYLPLHKSLSPLFKEPLARCEHQVEHQSQQEYQGRELKHHRPGTRQTQYHPAHIYTYDTRYCACRV